MVFHLDHLPAECFEAQFEPQYLDPYSIGVLAYRCVRVHSPFAKCANSPTAMLAAKQAGPVVLHGVTPDTEHLAPIIAALTQPNAHKRLPIDDILVQQYFK